MQFTSRLEVDESDAAVLAAWIHAAPASVRARRARIVLLSRDGLGATTVADRLGCSRQTVVNWRERYRELGPGGLVDAPRTGRPVTVDTSVVIARTLRPPPAGRLRWSTRLLGAELGISNAAVANVWRGWGLLPGGDGTLRLATDPPVDAACDAVVGLYADATVRVLVVAAAADGRPGPATAVLGRGLPALLDLPERAGAPDPEALAAMLARFDGGAHRSLVAGALPVARGPARYVAPDARCWARLAQVTCMIAAASPAGARSVDDLVAHLARTRPGRAVSWTVSRRSC